MSAQSGMFADELPSLGKTIMGDIPKVSQALKRK